MTDQKEVAKSFVAAMIQRGCFDDAKDNQARVTEIVGSYKLLVELLTTDKKNLAKSDFGL